MTEYDALIQTIALTMGVAWASGINLYAAVGMLGLGGALGYVDLPPTLEVVQDPLVILAAAFMYCVQFMADKVPGVDTGWDALHTFVRIPAGAALAAGAVGDVTPALAIAAGLVGGSVTAATHATKAGSRVLINTSPEPFTNWAASFAEDLAVFAGLWAALEHPVLFLALFGLFLLLLCWLLPKLWRAIRLVLSKLGAWLGVTRAGGSPDGDRLPGPGTPDDLERNRRELERLARSGVLSESEYQAAQARLTSA